MKFTTCALLALFAAATPAEEVPRAPRKRPDGGAIHALDVAVLRSAIPHVKTGAASGELWFEPQGGKSYRGAASLAVPGAAGAGGDEPAPTALSFQLDADFDPLGAEEDLAVPVPAADMLQRIVASSDFSLLPIRLLLPHRMDYSGGSREAGKEVAVTGGGATVDMTESRLGTQQFDGVHHDVYFTRVLRRFQPSGYQIHDYVLTAEDADEGFVMAGFALRVLVHPSAVIGGEHPEGGVMLLARVRARQLKRPGGDALAPDQDVERLEQTFEQQLGNALLARMSQEGIGDPFDSPSAVALRDADLLDAKTVQRLINTYRDDAKPLAMLAPLLVGKRIQFDPAAHLKLWKSADDPVRRLLLAAGAAAGGSQDPRFRRELELALTSKDAQVLRAAAVLATALGDSVAAAAARSRLGSR